MENSTLKALGIGFLILVVTTVFGVALAIVTVDHAPGLPREIAAVEKPPLTPSAQATIELADMCRQNNFRDCTDVNVIAYDRFAGDITIWSAPYRITLKGPMRFGYRTLYWRRNNTYGLASMSAATIEPDGRLFESSIAVPGFRAHYTSKMEYPSPEDVRVQVPAEMLRRFGLALVPDRSK